MASRDQYAERVAKRQKCFGACNVGVPDCFESDDVKCPMIDDCKVASVLMNDSYNPDKEESDSNAVTFVYTKASKAEKIDLEKQIDKTKAKAEKKATKTAAPRRRARAEEPEEESSVDDDVESLNENMEELLSAGGEAKKVIEEEGVGDDDLSELIDGDDAPAETPTEAETEEEVLTETDEVIEKAAKKAKKKAAAPSEAEVIEGDSVKMWKYLIDYAVKKLVVALTDSGAGEVVDAKVDAGEEVDEKPARKRRTTKKKVATPKKAPKAAKKPVAKKKSGKRGPKPGTKYKKRKRA